MQKTWSRKKSSHSGTEQGECVDVEAQTGLVLVWDSKDKRPEHLQAVLGFSANAWTALVDELKTPGSPMAGGL